MPRVDPLHWSVKIVDQDGRPTPEFLRQWNAQRSVNEAVGGGGSTTFAGLTDTPASYSGAALKVVRVNAGASQLEFGVVLGTMAVETASNYTPTSGLATVAISGAYSDLSGLPTLGALAAGDDAGDVPYSNASSGLAATDVQAAIDEVEARVDSLEASAVAFARVMSIASIGA